MTFYQEINLLPDSEVNLAFLWQKIYQQIHLALVENKLPNGNSAIAISFPEYGDKTFPLGKKLRLHGQTESLLTQLEIEKWLTRFSDYAHISSIKAAPSSAQHAVFRRKQYRTNVERLARRRAKRKNESFDEAMKHFSQFKDQKSDLPYIDLRSLSKVTQFKLFIQRQIQANPTEGDISCYGLSSSASVPLF